MIRTGLFLIASFPKSGNTWVRCLIASLLSGGRAPNLDQLGTICPLAASRHWIESQVGIPTSDLTPDEIAEARIEAHRLAARDPTAAQYLKIHDAYSSRLFHPEATCGIVHIVRDPRDVAVSSAHHSGENLDSVIDRIGRSGMVASVTSRQWRRQAEQVLDTWSNHVASWLDITQIPIVLLRYEDLRSDPLRETLRLARFLGLECDMATIGRAVGACDFQVLREIEEKSGFAERPPRSSDSGTRPRTPPPAPAAPP